MFPKKETLLVEFKDDSRDSFDFGDIIKECVGMSNAEGGDIYCGLKDDGTPVGSKVALKKGIDGIKYEIRAKTKPSIECDVEIISLNADCKVVKISVPKGESTVCSSKGNYVKRFVDAKGEPGNEAMDEYAILNAAGRIGTRDLTAQPLKNLTLADIDLDLVQKIADEIKSNSIIDSDIHIFSQEPIDILMTMRLVNKTGAPNIACLLLFGYEDSILDMIPNHFIQYQVFAGDGDELVKNIKYTSPIVKLLPELLKQPELNRCSNELVANGKSIVIPEYANNSIREAIANAINHRDYTLHSGIQIQVYPRELIVCSAGGFVSGIDIKNLLNTPPSPRNRILNDAMTRLKLVESSGRGIDTIFYWQARYGRPAPDYSMSDSTKVSVVLAGGDANMDFVKEMLSCEVKNVFQMLILNTLFVKGSQSLSDLSTAIQLNNKEDRTKSILAEMIRKKLITPVGYDNNYFVLSSQKEFPKKLTKAESMQIKVKILELLKKSVALSKSDLSAILAISEPQTYRLLKSLKDDDCVDIDPITKVWLIKK